MSRANSFEEFARPSHGQGAVCLVAPCVFLLLLSGCAQPSASAAPPASGEPSPSTFKAPLQPSAGIKDDVLTQDDREERRGYGIVDMRHEACVKAQDDQTLRVENCPPGIVIYGPYVSIPANSEIEVAFDVEPSQKLEVYADVVSQMGKQIMAGLNPQTVEPASKTRLGYHLKVFQAEHDVESRIGFRGSEPGKFVVSNYTMTVR
jgi:hypothetical protein